MHEARNFHPSTGVAVLFLLLVAPLCGAQCPCYLNMPTGCMGGDLDCAITQTFLYCLQQCCSLQSDQPANIQQLCESAEPFCSDSDCAVSCDVLRNCGSASSGEADGLATKWVIIIALGSALAGVLISVGLALLGAWRKRAAQTYETLN
nr:hypothetical protein [Pandoravirus belohorizontensis]